MKYRVVEGCNTGDKTIIYKDIDITHENIEKIMQLLVMMQTNFSDITFEKMRRWGLVIGIDKK